MLLEQAFLKRARIVPVGEGVILDGKICTAHLEIDGQPSKTESLVVYQNPGRRSKESAELARQYLCRIADRFNVGDDSLADLLYESSDPVERAVLFALISGVLEQDFRRQIRDESRYSVKKGCISDYLSGENAVTLTCEKFNGCGREIKPKRLFAFPHDVETGHFHDNTELRAVLASEGITVIGMDSCILYSGRMPDTLQIIYDAGIHAHARKYFFGGQTTFPPEILLMYVDAYGTRTPEQGKIVIERKD